MRLTKRALRYFGAYHHNFQKRSKRGEKARKAVGSAGRCELTKAYMRQVFLPLENRPLKTYHPTCCKSHFNACVRIFCKRQSEPGNSACTDECTRGIAGYINFTSSSDEKIAHLLLRIRLFIQHVGTPFFGRKKVCFGFKNRPQSFFF